MSSEEEITFRFPIARAKLLEQFEDRLKTTFNQTPHQLHWIISMLDTLLEYLQIPIELKWKGNFHWDLPEYEGVLVIELRIYDEPEKWPKRTDDTFFLNNWGNDEAFAFYQAVHFLGKRKLREHYQRQEEGAKYLKKLCELFNVPIN